ncbi:MAG: 16S rRNA (guanine(966)-N(2))-methyltransferase RsmD, partial [Flavobacteriaceae bacterium]|nr:16S rRNA (guanine(966)-N(2))-methyltransferase RsmD [Flavobacteriaceae bacterium]
VIFADPPYNIKDEKYYEIINIIFKNKILKNDGFLIIEHSSKTQINQHDFFFENRKYGDSSFSFYKYINN